MTKKHIIVGLFTLSILASATTAFGGTDRDISRAMVRQEAIAVASGDIRIQGAISCHSEAAISGGGSCLMSIRDALTGTSYRLENAGRVQALYENGSRTAEVVGNVVGDRLIAVVDVKAL